MDARAKICASAFSPGAVAGEAGLTPRDFERMLAVVQELSFLRDLQSVMNVVHVAARELTGADGVTFVLREGDHVFYADENAIAPLWRGRRFPASCCISGWCMMHRQTVAIEDVFADARIPHEAYRPTFVKSLAIAPIRVEDPLGAIGAYWATRHRPSARELSLLTSLAGTTAMAMVNAELFAEAKRAASIREEFITLAAHELCTPLTPLKLKLAQLRRETSGGLACDSRLAVSLGQLDRYVGRMESLVGNLIVAADLMQGVPEPIREEMDLAVLAADVIEHLRQEGHGGRDEILLEAVPARGRWDRAAVEQVVRHLLLNALKFGAGRPVRVGVTTDAKTATLSVHDHGIGISTDDQRRIFEPFERAVEVDHFGGLGLGLWIVRCVVQAHGGSVSVESVPERGSAFVVRLPRSLPQRCLTPVPAG